MSLRVLDPGLHTLVVDLGRPHCRSLGVPVGGAADRTSLTLGNALVGNPPGAAALECSLAGPTLRAEWDLACVVYGAPFGLRCDRQALASGKTFTLRAGEELHIEAAGEGMRAYLCVRGGLQTPMILGSRSALAPLREGDELPCHPGTIAARFLRDGPETPRGPERALRAVRGAQADWFGAGPLLAGAFRVTPASNRMGLRLDGSPLLVSDRELVSEPVCPGAVQVTRDGQCIVLGVDGQTIGGYPKVAQVISADLDVVGQLRPGDTITFAEVALAEAERLYRAQQAELRAWVTRVRAAVGEVP
jgi:biotin-dependent carboxylase-like uncharacterized protein